MQSPERKVRPGRKFKKVVGSKDFSTKISLSVLMPLFWFEICALNELEQYTGLFVLRVYVAMYPELENIFFKDRNQSSSSVGSLWFYIDSPKNCLKFKGITESLAALSTPVSENLNRESQKYQVIPRWSLSTNHQLIQLHLHRRWASGPCSLHRSTKLFYF